MNKHSQYLLAASHLVLTFILVSGISWWLFAKADFLYGLWHDHGGIAQGIDTYGAQNKYRFGFEKTTRQERLRLFSEINRSVHNDGLGLSEIRYHLPNGKNFKLLRHPEIVHLRDVARLISHLQTALWLLLPLWLILSVLIRRTNKGLLKFKIQASAIAALVAVSVALLLIIGPERVFNQMHIWIFPAGNEWFFYYQDSLMSTLMLAPRLFAFIAAEMVLLALVLYLVVVSALRKI